MNVFTGIGRLTEDVDMKYTPNGTAVARFTIAINRPFKNKDGNYEADFINCVAFGKRAETIAEYVRKGHRIGVTGSIMTGSYENNQGQKVYTTNINVTGFTFLESAKKTQKPKTQTTVDAEPIQIEDEGLPF